MKALAKLLEVLGTLNQKPAQKDFVFFKSQTKDEQGLIEYNMNPAIRTCPNATILCSKERGGAAAMKPSPGSLNRPHIVAKSQANASLVFYHSVNVPNAKRSARISDSCLAKVTLPRVVARKFRILRTPELCIDGIAQHLIEVRREHWSAVSYCPVHDLPVMWEYIPTVQERTKLLLQSTDLTPGQELQHIIKFCKRRARWYLDKPGRALLSNLNEQLIPGIYTFRFYVSVDAVSDDQSQIIAALLKQGAKAVDGVIGHNSS